MSKKKNGSQIATNFIMPARDKKLIEGMNRMMNLFTRHCSDNSYAIKTAIEIFNEYVSKEEAEDYLNETLKNARAKIEEAEREREEFIKKADENFKKYDVMEEDLSYIPEEGIEFEYGKYRLTKDGRILSKAKGWKPLALTEKDEYIKCNNEAVHWQDYTFKGTINSISTRVSVRLLIHQISLCVRDNSPIILDRDKLTI